MPLLSSLRPSTGAGGLATLMDTPVVPCLVCGRVRECLWMWVCVVCTCVRV